MTRLTFFFDIGSPWTYLAFHRIEALAQNADAELVWKPILVGGVFNAVNRDVYAQRANPTPAKARYHAKDLQDWARHLGLQIRWPRVFPVNSVRAMRGALVAHEQGRLREWSRACFEAYWGEGRDISERAVLGALASHAGLAADALLAQIERDDIKARLRANTDELIAHGGFGSPSMLVGESDLYFGNDRLPLVEAALRRAR